MAARLLTALALLILGTGFALADVRVDVTFSSREAETIRAWFRDHGHEADRKGRKSLPPGIAKNLARGKPLPPGIAKQALPPGLVERLPPPPRGYERIIVDGKVLLVEIATRIIHDVLLDAVLR